MHVHTHTYICIDTFAYTGPYGEATHAALSNLTHSIVSHHVAMVEQDEWWVQLDDQVRVGVRVRVRESRGAKLALTR